MARKPRKLSEWVSASANSTFRTYGISPNEASLNAFMQQLHDEAIARLMRSQGKSKDEATQDVESHLVRQGENATGRTVWHIQRSQIPQLVSLIERESQWIGSSNNSTLGKHGITCASFTAEILMKELHDYDIQERRLGGATKEDATRQTEETLIRRGTSRSGNDVWQIRESQMQLLRDWVEHDKGWISSTNNPRLSAEGVSIDRERVDEEIAKLARNQIKQRSATSGQDAARHYVSHFIARRSQTEQGNAVWQIHSDAMGLLSDQINHNDGWINSHNRTRLPDHGIILPAAVIDPILKEFHLRHVLAISRERHIPEADAQRIVESQMLRPALTRYGQDSWDIHESFFPTLLTLVPQLGPRREEDWIPIASSRSLAFDVRAGKDIQTKAAQAFKDQNIQRYIDIGAPADEAASYVASHIVKRDISNKGRPTWKIHTAFMPEFKAFIDALPHRERYASRIGDGVLSSPPENTSEPPATPDNTIHTDEAVMKDAGLTQDKDGRGNGGRNA